MTKEELEKEAEEFTDSKKSFWRQGRTCIDSVKQAYLASAEPREKRIEELTEHNETLMLQIQSLGKENAELKGLKDVATLIRANNDTVTTLMQLNNMLVSKTQQLTKAKKIIKMFMSNYPRFTTEEMQLAEQFLSEEVDK